MFYRRKIILALLQLFEGQLDKISLQKLLFLCTTQQIKPEYNFIPFKYGGYSFSANADITAMVRKGMISEDEKQFQKQDTTDYVTQLKIGDRSILQKVKKDYGGLSAMELMKLTYIYFPFYAIKSEAAPSILSNDELEKVNTAKPKSDKTVLFTIGYEGISLEAYLLRLLENDVKVLVDVRNNPLSMKYGFSKSLLSKFCSSLGIEYVHIPEVGIQSDQRQALNAQSDYDKLFAIYRQDNLTRTQNHQKDILNLLQQHKRIALTCFEANICQCHRKHLAEAVQMLPGFIYEVKHI